MKWAINGIRLWLAPLRSRFRNRLLVVGQGRGHSFFVSLSTSRCSSRPRVRCWTILPLRGEYGKRGDDQDVFKVGPKTLRFQLAGIFWFVALWACSLRGEDVPLWGRWEYTLTATSAITPETELSAELTSPSGRKFTVSGFWDGNFTWRIRFMPVEVGEWHFRTRSIPAVEGLNAVSGEFRCQPSVGANRFLQHGPVRVSANGRFFEHADGTPFFWLGDTVWYGAILSSKADWETYLSDRVDKQFSVVHFNVVAPRNGVLADENGEVSFEGAGRFESHSRIERLRWKALRSLGLDQTKMIKINPRFYQRLDERIDAVNSHGLLAAIVLTWGLRAEDSGNALPETQVVRLVRYLKSRYSANHVVWILTGDNAYEGTNGERWKRIGRAAFDDGQPHAPVTTHPSGMHWPWDSFRNENWLDFIVYQSGHGDDADSQRWIHSGPPSEQWQNSPPRPFINLEPPYEGHLGYQSRKPFSDSAVRRAIYWSLLNAPTAGVSYGAHGVWSWHTAAGQPPTDHPTTGIAKVWREALSLPGSGQMKHVMEFFTSIDWWKLQPDSNLVAEQPTGDDAAGHVSAARSAQGDLAMIYLPAGGTIRLQNGILRERLHAEWLNPRTGQRTAIAGPSTTHFLAPDQQDWVLLLHEN